MGKLVLDEFDQIGCKLPIERDMPQIREVNPETVRAVGSAGSAVAMGIADPKMLLTKEIIDLGKEIAHTISQIGVAREQTKQVRAQCEAMTEAAKQQTEQTRISETQATERIKAQCMQAITESNNKVEELRIVLESNEMIHKQNMDLIDQAKKTAESIRVTIDRLRDKDPEGNFDKILKCYELLSIYQTNLQELQKLM